MQASEIASGKDAIRSFGASLLGAPGLTSRNKDATRSKDCY